MKSVVCFGGGNATPKVIMEELRKHPVRITGITSMVDSGGSTGQLRNDFNVLPPGDIRRHLLALSDAPEWKKQLWKFRFGHEDFGAGHVGHVFGNVFLAGLEHVLGDYERALEIAHGFLEVKGHRAMPATLEKTHVLAELEDGQVVRGEDDIDVPKNRDPHVGIRRVWLEPRARAYPRALEAVEAADAVIFGIGDLYSSLVPCILPEGMKEALQKTKAKKILVCPAMTKLGETQNFSVSDFAGELERYMGCALDSVIFNNAIPGKERVEKHKKDEPHLLEAVDFGGVPAGGKFVGRGLLLEDGAVAYDPEKVVGAIMECLS